MKLQLIKLTLIMTLVLLGNLWRFWSPSYEVSCSKKPNLVMCVEEDQFDLG